MKFSDLKSLVEQGKLAQFEEQIEKQVLVAADYDLLLREIIKNKVKNFEKYFHLLVKKGADVNFANLGLNKKSNLMVACEQGTPESVQLLCSHPKIDFCTEDSMKKTAPFYAIENKNKNDGQIFLTKILKKAPNLIHRPANNQTMLILAIKRQKPQLVKILLSNRAEPNYVITDSGNTALHEALKLCKAKQTRVNRQIVKLLIQNGANPNIKNKKDKNAFQFAQKFSLQTLIDEIQVKPIVKQQDTNSTQKRQEKMVNQSAQKKKKVLLKANTQNEIDDMIRNADRFYRRQKNGILSNKEVQNQVFVQKDGNFISDDQTSSEEQQFQNQEDQGLCSFRKSQNIIDQLTIEIQELTQKCEQYNRKVSEDMQLFLQKFRYIAHKQGFNVELYGSFRTGLWLKNCDIDILLIPHDQFVTEKNPNFVQTTLDKFQTIFRKQFPINNKGLIKNKKIKVPMLRFDIELPNPHGSNSKMRKIDITVIDRNHNGLAIAHYISENLKVFPQLKPLFFTIKSLTYHFKLNDPKNGGIRTYGIIIMILSFLQTLGRSPNQFSLGQLLLRFLFFFGYEYQYGYGFDSQLRQEQYMDTIQQPPRQASMLLTIHDPLNPLNNLGKHSKAYELQTTFKAAYIGLHSNIQKGKKLQNMFDLKNIILPI